MITPSLPSTIKPRLSLGTLFSMRYQMAHPKKSSESVGIVGSLMVYGLVRAGGEINIDKRPEGSWSNKIYRTYATKDPKVAV